MTAHSAPLETLALLLTPSELRRVAAALDLTPRASRASREVAPDHRDATAALLTALLSEGSPPLLAPTLRTVATIAERRPPPPEVVWSGPHLDGDSHRTTEAIVRLVDNAEESVLASTYSGSAKSPFVDALRRAAQRKVEITLVVDIVEMGEATRAIGASIPRATVLAYHHTVDGKHGLQHAKVLVIDSRTCLVTSANLSVAAIERNLEVGILLDDPAVAGAITRRIADLRASDHLQRLP